MEQIGFFLGAIKTEQFAFFEESFNPEENAHIDSNVEFKIKKEHHQLGVFVTFSFSQNEKVVIKLGVSCHFMIKPEDWKACLEGGQIIFPKQFLTHLLMLVVGTSRGILHCKLEGTKMQGVVLPSINISEVLKEDVTFPI